MSFGGGGLFGNIGNIFTGGLSGLISGTMSPKNFLMGGAFGGFLPGDPQQAQQLLPPTPTPAPEAPDRSDAEIQQAAIRQRRRYGITGGATSNMLTGGMGVAPSSTYSAVTAVLGGGTPGA